MSPLFKYFNHCNKYVSSEKLFINLIATNIPDQVLGIRMANDWSIALI